MLRDVAIEEGVDPELYDRVIDLRRIAAGSQADQQERPAPKPKPKPKPKPAAAAASSNGRKRGQRAPA
jgi:hypothetical protein